MSPLPELLPSSFACTLCSLTLSFAPARDIAAQEHMTRMVARLRNFPALRTLHISIAGNMYGYLLCHPPSSYSRAILENIRDLTIHGPWIPSLVPDCPNITDLTLGLHELRSQSAAGLQWPALRTLALVYAPYSNFPTRVQSSCITRASRLWLKPSPAPADHYPDSDWDSDSPTEHCNPPDSQRETGESFANTLPGLSTLSFSCTLYWFCEKADLSDDDDGVDGFDDDGAYVRSSEEAGTDVWDPPRLTPNEAALVRVAARLRSLHLDVHPSVYRGYVFWWETLTNALPNVLAAAPLVHLTLVLVPYDHTAEEVSSSWAADELARVRAAREIPRRLAEAIATLRVLQVGDAMPHVAWLPPLQVRRYYGDKYDDKYDDKSEEEEWERCVQEMAAMEAVRQRRWWWIERRDSSAVMTEIWRDDGERARELVEEDGFDRDTGLDVSRPNRPVDAEMEERRRVLGRKKDAGSVATHWRGSRRATETHEKALVVPAGNAMSLMSLDDDVLLCIFAYLDTEDAFRIAFTAKRPYILALPYSLADVNLTSALTGRTDGPLSRLPVDSVLRRLAYAEWMIKHVTTVLPACLRSLAIPDFHHYRTHSPDLINRLADFTQLRTLVLSSILTMPTDNTPLPDLPPLALAHTLHSLDLAFPSKWVIEHREHVAHIVARLQAFPALRTLCLRSNSMVTPQETSALLLPPSSPARATLPNIHNLTILRWSPQPVPECPHVEELTLDPGELHSQSIAGLQWPSIRSLTILYHGEYDWPTRRGASCIKRELPGLATLLFSCTLFWFLDLSDIQTGRTPEPGRFTDNETALARVAARLRSLHIDVHHSNLVKDASWGTFVSAIPQVLAAAPLVHLTLVLVPRDHKSDAVVRSNWAADELARVRAAREIPRRLAEAIATLRVLQVGDAMPHTAWLPPLQVRRYYGDKYDDKYDDKSEEEEWERCVQEMAAMEAVRRRRWWWIERRDSSAVMTEIWREDGERARDLVEEDGFDRATGLDGCRATTRQQSSALMISQHLAQDHRARTRCAGLAEALHQTEVSALSYHAPGASPSARE
ncbi:uncharacterized protein BXZ73DRAFT_76098 [Epithele typhae]|uniref:uncharacterized protein n=1 Tax=Epithele typhae TaxID=378194 RepID=UPI0020089C35|nr:uncharacterized protein BXZ73DRAFT_76098 [Epithele typhae]KAH9939400.1 hypothetical protein BXZ73DRAFT_76098 [Epithele typhae]